MRYRKLGNTNIDVSVICLGTMTFGEQNTDKEGFQQMDYAFDRGVNFLIQLNYMLLCREKILMEKLKKLLVIG